MLTYPQMNPFAFHIGSLYFAWYGIMYLFGIFFGWLLLSLRIHLSPRGITQSQLINIIFFASLGVVLGGRLGKVFFYRLPVSFSDLFILETWENGMSFHGGLIGVLIALWIYSKKTNQPFLKITDILAPVIPIGLAAGRIGNFINGQLWGRVTNLPWGMVFPRADQFPRHPSQLYECLLEGVCLFVILWTVSSKPRPMGMISGLFLFCYGVFRCIAELFREPDAPIGYLIFGLTEGQLLSFPLILFGIFLLIRSKKRNTYTALKNVQSLE